MKIVSTGATLSSPEYHEKRKREKRRKRIVILLIFLSLLAAFVIVSRLKQLRISDVTVVGARVITNDEVAKTVRDTLSGHYLWVIPKNSALLYSREKVENSLRRNIPRFASVSVALAGSNSLDILVMERDPFALFCQSAERPQDASACFFLDESGFIFDEAPAFSGNVYFVYASEAAIESPKGVQFIPAEEFRNLAGLVSGLSILELKPLALEVGEREINLVLPDDAKIIWKRGIESGEIYANLEAFLNSDEIKADPEFLTKIHLLDLRTENKVFYRFRE